MYDYTREQWMKEQEVLIDELSAMQTAWGERADAGEPEVKFARLTGRQSQRVRASILATLRREPEAVYTVPEMIDAMVDWVGLWLPTVPDGVVGYLGELQKLQSPHNTQEFVVLIEGSQRSLKSRWKYGGFFETRPV